MKRGLNRRCALGGLVAGVLLLTMALPGCKPTAKGESQKFDRAKEAVTEYSTRWPAFKTVLTSQLKKATEQMEAAKKISAEDKKAEAMKAANETVGKLTSRIGEVKYKIEGIEKTITKLNRLAIPKKKKKERKRAIKKAREAIEKVEKGMKEAKPTDQATAMAALKPLINNLITASGNIDRKYKALGGGKKKKKKKKNN